MNKLPPIECQCGGYHYIQVDEWDEKDGSKIVAFVGEPHSFWHWLKEWRKHRQMYIDDVILSKGQLEELKKLL